MKEVLVILCFLLLGSSKAGARKFNIESLTTYLGGSRLMDITATPKKWTAEANEKNFSVRNETDEVVNFVFLEGKTETAGSIVRKATEVYSAMKSTVELKQQTDGTLIVICKFSEVSEFVYKLKPIE